MVAAVDVHVPWIKPVSRVLGHTDGYVVRHFVAQMSQLSTEMVPTTLGVQGLPRQHVHLHDSPLT
jgi:hypothetical protein